MNFVKKGVFVLLFALSALGFVHVDNAHASYDGLLEKGISKYEINKQIEFRETFGLDRSNERLLEVSNLSSDNKYGVPLTQDELKSLTEKDAFADKYAPVIIEQLRGKSFNSNHATFYRDNKNGGILVVGLVKGNSRNQEVMESIKSKIPKHALEKIKFHTVKYSEEELDKIVNKISDERNLLKENDISITSVSANIKENNIQVGIDPYTNEAVSFLKNRYGQDLIEVIKKEEATTESRTTSYYYMYGGLQISGTSSGSTGTSGYCSNGYSISNYRGDFIVTAGHCTKNWSSFYQGGYSKGSVYSTSQGGYADVGVVKLSSNRTTNGIYRYSANDRKMTSYQYVNSDYVGQSVAQTGATTGVTSGEIENRNWSGYVRASDGTRHYYQYLRDASYKSAGGDSGGTVYWGNELRGIHTASNGKFSHIHYVNSKTPGTPKTN